jgi:Methyltransferase domain
MWGIPMFGIRSKLQKRFGLYPQLKDKDGHVARFLYKTKPAVRYGWGRKPANKYFEREFKERTPAFRARLERYASLAPFFSKVLRESDGTKMPYWKNQLLPVIDAVSICGMMEEFQPRRFVEIGSGNSTRFACLAKELAPQCEVISIDGFPGDTIAAFPDRMIKQRLQDADLSIFGMLEANDIVWMDGSHHCFSDTDVAAFFMDVMPSLAPGVIVGVHDIPLPWDYPPEWGSTYFNELQVMAAYLVGGGKAIEYLLPAFYLNNIDMESRAILDPIWGLPALAAPLQEVSGGGAFWFKAP